MLTIIGLRFVMQIEMVVGETCTAGAEGTYVYMFATA